MLEFYKDLQMAFIIQNFYKQYCFINAICDIKQLNWWQQ